ncbi:MAG: ribosomal protein S5, nonfunctional [Candidatus Uhrbacteria bacterium GW2011_GWF2_39_13]|uniref:Small ribosomal subunit protein uS5 n=1 Tax=Candidatus Uhrbacteria bacterium GW2011_GWF2_39_13 TaxID=1618995 RepID=A0A0G0MKX3_9BACT|nr:MAG: ribosomal protein S5, nonfunctional [Candidatus Uhrbacteria bacterium GW2011_GWF2_39_13]HAU66748.1 30S ribosomal protein S5 [Candidatus Uhrbacteria bacterium]
MPQEKNVQQTKGGIRTAKRSDNSDRSSDNKRGRGPRRGKREERVPREFDQKILDLVRVTRVTAGGKRMSFRCALVIGDKKGRVGMGVAKGADVQIAIEKAYKQAKKHVITVPLAHETIPHPIWIKFGSALVLLKPAPKGTGLKSGGAVRMILEFAGIPNAVSKIVNSSNKINIAKATLEAIKQLRVPENRTPKVEASIRVTAVDNI